MPDGTPVPEGMRVGKVVGTAEEETSSGRADEARLDDAGTGTPVPDGTG